MFARLCTPVALIMLLWSPAVRGQDIRTLGVDQYHRLGYASGSSEAAAQVQTVLELTSELKRLLQEFGPAKVPQILAFDPQGATASSTPVRFRFRVGMFVEDVTATMVSLFSEYQRGKKCDKALVQSLEKELKSSGGGTGGVFGQEVAAVRKRCA